MFTGWIYDFLKPHAADLKVAHPEMLKAITAAKKKNDRADAEKLADLLRVSLLSPDLHYPEIFRINPRKRSNKETLNVESLN